MPGSHGEDTPDFPVRLTQAVIADAPGLTAVHLDRMMRTAQHV